jgi:hypothetical protein
MLRPTILLLGLLSALCCRSQTADAAKPPFVPVFTQIRKTVVFLELQCKDGNELKDVKGTGFLVQYPGTKSVAFGYVVTNRHLALCWNEKNRPMEVKSITVRVNLKDGTSPVIPLSLDGNVRWYFPADESVDLAVSRLGPPSNADVLMIPLSMVATKDVIASKHIVEGMKIIFTGFFYQFPGVRKIQPIIREGVLAMMPDEPITTYTGKPGMVYLGDVHIFGGNSGSPVFVDIAGPIPNGIQLDDYYLLGVVSGYFYEDQDFNLEVATTLKGTQHANSGISIIVPAEAVRDLIENNPDLKLGRETALKNLK